MKLLLDVHIKKATVDAIHQLKPNLDVLHISDWYGSKWMEASDEEILIACVQEKRVLVTFDQATIPGLLRRWAAEGRDHAGVFFGDRQTVHPARPGVVAASIMELVVELGATDTVNIVRYLRPVLRI